MSKKDRFFGIMELFINDSRKSLLEEYYGKGSKVKINSLTTSPTKNECIFDVTVTLGEEIKEEYLQEEFADLLIQKAFKMVYPEYKVKTMVKFES